MLMVLLQGSRGLFCSDDKRIYFPDRSWSDARPCLIKDYTVVKDKDTYAFIKAQPLSTEPINILDLDYYINDYHLRKVTLDSSEFLLGTISSSSMNMGFNLWYKQNGVVYKETLKSIPELVNLYLKGEEATCDIIKYYSATCKLDTEERYNTLLIRSLSKMDYSGKADLHIINNCFLRITLHYTYTKSTDSSYYCLSKDDKLISLGYDCASKLDKKIKSVKEVDKSLINKLVSELGLTIKRYANTVSFSDNICRVDIKNEYFFASIYAFKADTFSYDYYNSEESALERKVVQASLDAYNKMVKSIGKSLTGKSAISVLKDISLKKNLVGGVF